jgi:cytochrome c peroxidase
MLYTPPDTKRSWCRVRRAAVAALLTFARGWPIALIGGWLSCAVVVGQDSKPMSTSVPSVQFRRPVALHAWDRLLVVANRRSGTLSTVDPIAHRVLEEYQLGGTLSDLVPLGSDALLVSDEQARQVILLELDGHELLVGQRCQLPVAPVSLAVSPQGRTATAAALWARQIVLLKVDRERSDQLSPCGAIDLPFAPRLQQFLPDGRTLVVADAFGGSLALVDVVSRRVVAWRQLEGHNIAGLAVSPDGQDLLIAHQLLGSRVPTIPERVSWGQVVGNFLRSVRIQHLLEAADRDASPTGVTSSPASAIARWTLWPLGQHHTAAGDPGATRLLPSAELAICLGGVHELGLMDTRTGKLRRVPVGRRPVACALDPLQTWVYVANNFDDSISIVDWEQGQTVGTVSLGKVPAPSLVDRGETLFYDARLALDGWFSCHSCHTHGHTSGQLNDNYGDHTFGTPKQVPSLLGTGSTNPWAWDGGQQWLSDQVRRSIQTTMRGPGDAHDLEDAVAAITEYLRSLPPAPSLQLARGAASPARLAEEGRRLFQARDCTACHVPPTYTSFGVHDVGIDDEARQHFFNPPSLLGTSQKRAWLHDNRAHSLHDVLHRVGHPHGESQDLTITELRALVAFLESL